jgi:mannose-1-phosphate guanylyltransferase/phosphomannomutase
MKSPVHAMVMAAGAGTRLRPLTHATPKPMVPIANRPVLEYTLENLKRHGITEMVLNLYSHPDLIRRHFGDGSAWGVQITYSHEPSLLGTAGGVKKVERFLNGGTFLVLSGDGLTTLDLTALLAFHRRRKSLGTMALTNVYTRFEYGITLANPRGRIRRFIEKPLWSDVFSSQVNTGIYVFEPEIFDAIPKGRVYDFGKQLWPKLLKAQAPIYGYPTKAYWCDVGNLSEYRRAQRDVLDGKMGIRLPGRQIRPGIWVEEGTVIDRSVKLEAPCLIGRDCRIAQGAHIGAYTVIGHRAHIGAKSVLRHCTLWNDVRVEKQVRLENCILGHGARAAENISVYEGAVINLSI